MHTRKYWQSTMSATAYLPFKTDFKVMCVVGKRIATN